MANANESFRVQQHRGQSGQIIMEKKMASIVLETMLKKKEEEEGARNSARSSERQLKMSVAETTKENAILKEQLSDVRLELNESKKTNAIIQKKLDGLNSFVKRIGGSTDFMLKGSTSFFRKENHTLKTKVSHTNKNLSDIKLLNEDLVRTHELDRRAIEELSATISDLEFRIRMGIVSDEYTSEYCLAAHEVVDHEMSCAKSKRNCENCDILKLQLAKNSISLQCLIGRLKQMEESIFELKNEKRTLNNQILALQDENFKY